MPLPVRSVIAPYEAASAKTSRAAWRAFTAASVLAAL